MGYVPPPPPRTEYIDCTTIDSRSSQYEVGLPSPIFDNVENFVGTPSPLRSSTWTCVYCKGLRTGLSCSGCGAARAVGESVRDWDYSLVPSDEPPADRMDRR